MTKPLRAGAFVKKHNDVICVYLETTARWETPRHPNPKTRLERGFGVLTADDGYEALRILSEKRPIDVLFADIVMPGMDGVQLARQAKLMRPEIKVLFATGYVQKATERNAIHVGRVLYKPLRQAEVIREVESLLAA